MYDFNQTPTDLNSITTGFGKSNLFIFTPRRLGDIAIRSNQFNFSRELANKFMTPVNPVEAVATFQGNEDVAKAILPSSQGMGVDTSLYDSLWSFVLILDESDANQATRFMPTPKTRKIIKGYFLDEPMVHQYGMTPIHNPDAQMVCTHQSRSNVSFELTHAGQKIAQTTPVNEDYVPQLAAQYVGNENLAVVDSASIARSTALGDGGTIVSAPGDNYIAGKSGSSAVIHNSSRCPRNELAAIGSALQSAQDAHDAREGFHDSFANSPIAEDPIASFTHQMASSVATGSQMFVGSGLDWSRPVTFGTLETYCPHLAVLPMEMPVETQLDVRGHSEISMQNTYSSLIASSIPAICSNLGISDISFRYSSTDMQGGRTALWEILDVKTSLGDMVPHERVVQMVNAFKAEMERSTLPTISVLSGHFNVIVSFNMAGATLVNLQLLDFPESNDCGYHEGHNQMGGLLSPALGNDQMVMHNTGQFGSLVNHLGGVVAGLGNPETYGAEYHESIARDNTYDAEAPSLGTVSSVMKAASHIDHNRGRFSDDELRN